MAFTQGNSCYSKVAMMMLTVKNVDIYYGRHKAVSNVSFTIQPGEIVGLIGPNGAGKTTIMKTLLGLTKFDGEIQFNGRRITENQHDALQQVGALIEQPAIYPFLSGWDNLKLYAHDEQALTQLVDRLGMRSYIQRKSKEYSVGMKQKLGIALALLDHPKLVILDEPMNGLDVEATILIRKIIKEYAAKGTAFLISSHVLSELQKVMTSVVIINNGRMIMRTSVDQFKHRDRNYLMLQTSDMAASKSLIQDYLASDKHLPGYFVIRNQDNDRVQKVLNQHHIWLTELQPYGPTFEQAIVKILRQKRGDQS